MPRTRFTNAKQDKLLALIADGHTVTHAAREVGVGRRTVYDHRDDDPAFAVAFDQAVEEGGEILEQEARRRAVDGTTKPVYQGGVRVGQVQEYSDTLLIFLLKGRFPEKYRERHSVDATVTVRQVVEGLVQELGLTGDEAQAAIAEAEALLKAGKR